MKTTFALLVVCSLRNLPLRIWPQGRRPAWGRWRRFGFPFRGNGARECWNPWWYLWYLRLKGCASYRARISVINMIDMIMCKQLQTHACYSKYTYTDACTCVSKSTEWPSSFFNCSVCWHVQQWRPLPRFHCRTAWALKRELCRTWCCSTHPMMSQLNRNVVKDRKNTERPYSNCSWSSLAFSSTCAQLTMILTAALVNFCERRGARGDFRHGGHCDLS